jgi:Uma2 family endonuclease
MTRNYLQRNSKMTTLPLTLPRNLNFDEYLAWALKQEDNAKAELVEGEIKFMSPVSEAHQSLSVFLLSLLNALVSSHNMGRVFFESFVMKLGARAGREPDILFVATANLHRVRENFLDGPADLIIEIVSPESRTRDKVTKLAEYQRLGVSEYWVLDQARTEALFYQMQEDGTYHLVPADENNIYRSIVVPGLWINVNWLWQNPLPSILDVLRQWQLI